MVTMLSVYFRMSGVSWLADTEQWPGGVWPHPSEGGASHSCPDQRQRQHSEVSCPQHTGHGVRQRGGPSVQAGWTGKP